MCYVCSTGRNRAPNVRIGSMSVNRVHATRELFSDTATGNGWTLDAVDGFSAPDIDAYTRGASLVIIVWDNRNLAPRSVAYRVDDNHGNTSSHSRCYRGVASASYGDRMALVERWITAPGK